MSRQQGLVTNYDKTKLIMVSVIGIAVLMIAIFTLLIIYFPGLKFSESPPADNDASTSVPNPTATPIKYSTLPTPTPLPTLTQEQYDTVVDEIENLEGEYPTEALEEIRNIPGGSEAPPAGAGGFY